MINDEAYWIKSMLSHNIRMPLAIISGYADLLREGLIKGENETQECINKICKNVKYLSNVVSLIIDGDLQTGLAYAPDRMNLAECVGEAAGYIVNSTGNMRVEVQVNCSPENIFILGDYTHILRMLFHLMENSIKYMKKEGHIIIDVKDVHSDYVILTYEDDGEGMAREETQHIFEDEFRGSNSENIYGTGMGMGYVREVVENHNGSIEVTSDIGKGMKISIILPAFDL